jgi:hypothetical protein
METKIYQSGHKEIIEIVTDEVVIKTPQDVVLLMEQSYGSEYFILHDYNFEKEFFDLSTRKLGETLQKLTNYRVKLAIVGAFETYPSKTLKDFIYESNKQGEYLFVSSVREVLTIWSR